MDLFQNGTALLQSFLFLVQCSLRNRNIRNAFQNTGFQNVFPHNIRNLIVVEPNITDICTIDKEIVCHFILQYICSLLIRNDIAVSVPIYRNIREIHDLVICVF